MNAETYKEAMSSLTALEAKTQKFRDLQKEIEAVTNQIAWLKSAGILTIEVNGYIVNVPDKLAVKDLLVRQFEDKVLDLKKQRDAL